MKWKCLFDNTQLTILTLGMAGLMAGCCTKSTGGSYTAYPATPAPAYPTGGTAETEETQTSANQQVIPLYKEQANVGTRQMETGTVRIHKVVKTETVNQPVQLRTESVVIDREPAATGGDTSQAFQNQDVEIHLHSDVPVVQTTVVPAGQIVAQTRADVQQTNIQTQIRRDSVTIDKGNAQNVIVSDKVQQDQSENENQPMGGGGEVGGQTTGAAAATITDLNTLTTAQDPNTLNGRQVQLNGVTVDSITGQTLVIKDSSGKQCFVKLSQPMSNIQAGSQVNITGTAGGLTPTSSEQIPQGSIYIQAQSVQPAQ